MTLKKSMMTPVWFLGSVKRSYVYHINDVVWNILNNKKEFNLQWLETSIGGSYLCQVLWQYKLNLIMYQDGNSVDINLCNNTKILKYQ